MPTGKSLGLIRMEESALNSCVIMVAVPDPKHLGRQYNGRALEKTRPAHHSTDENYRPGKLGRTSRRQFGNFLRIFESLMPRPVAVQHLFFERQRT